MIIHVRKDGTEHDLKADPTKTLLANLRDAGFVIEAPCGGNATCGKCVVELIENGSISTALSCKTYPTPGLTVQLADKGVLAVETGSALAIAEHFALDEHDEGNLGLAVDLGTTTIACSLYDLHRGVPLARLGMANPQASFGADVISRINACKEGSLDEMGRCVIACLQDAASSLCKRVTMPTSSIKLWAIGGNTVMEHILCGLSPLSIGVFPFEPLSLFGESTDIDGLDAPVYLSPCVAGYVGGDITAGLVACDLDHSDERALFADLGTNGELALADHGNITCCATATGPAFEGANIAFGMQARPGAISACRLGEAGFEVDVIGDSAATGICGAGAVSALAACLDAGLVDETGRIVDKDEPSPAWREVLCEYEDQQAIRLVEDGSVLFTQKDVRALQLAKASIRAGFETMMSEADLQVSDIDALYIGGAFGTHLDAEAAARVGLFPIDLLPDTHMVGNCAGAGMSAALISADARRRMKDVASHARYLELSTHPDFSTFYIEEMSFDESE